MNVKQIVVFLIVVSTILAPDIIFGFEIISTTTERDLNKGGRCQQEIQTLTSNLQEQQNFWIRFYNDSCELRQMRKAQQFEKKLTENNTEFGKKQKELIETVNKQNSLLQQFDQKIEKMGEKIGEIETKLANSQQELLEKIETKLVNIQQELLKQFKKEMENLGKIEHGKTTLPRSCLEILKKGNTLSGVYTIQPNSTSFQVWCDMDTRDGGWTYVLNRFDGSQDFYLDWTHYRNGFGNLNGEFWLGLQHLYELTGSHDNQLLIELVDWDNKHFHAMYNTFRIGSEEEGYPIKILDGYSGDAGDSLTYHKYMKFSTHDRDQDTYVESCAQLERGAWWYSSCQYSNLAGTYYNTAKDDYTGMVWYYLKDNYISLKKAKMMIRPH